MRSAQHIRPVERWTKRYNWENYAQADLEIQPVGFLEEERMRELERKDRMRLEGHGEGEEGED